MKSTNCDKLIIAVLQDDDFREVIDDLNTHGFYVTLLQSSGGFMKKKNATIMIGVNHEYLEEALELLKHYGKRTETKYEADCSVTGSSVTMPFMPPVPVSVDCGGIVIFVTDVSRYERY